jgi:hypothetical protein
MGGQPIFLYDFLSLISLFKDAVFFLMVLKISWILLAIP